MADLAGSALRLRELSAEIEAATIERERLIAELRRGLGPFGLSARVVAGLDVDGLVEIALVLDRVGAVAGCSRDEVNALEIVAGASPVRQELRDVVAGVIDRLRAPGDGADAASTLPSGFDPRRTQILPQTPDSL